MKKIILSSALLLLYNIMCGQLAEVVSAKEGGLKNTPTTSTCFRTDAGDILSGKIMKKTRPINFIT